MSDMTQVLADVMARSIHAATATLLVRLAALESKEPALVPVVRDGRDVDPLVVKAFVAESVAAAVKELPPPKDGKDGASIEMSVVKALVTEAVGALPAPKDGAKGADGKSVDEATVQAMVDTAVKALPTPKDGQKGEDGKSIDLVTVKALVAEVVGALPVPKGEKGDKGEPGSPGSKGDQGLKGEKGDSGASGIAGPKGEPGKGEPGTKGDKGEAGPSGPSVKGDAGAVGPAGKDADPLQLKSLQDEVTRLREEVIVLKSIPSPKDGRDGVKGDTGHSVTSALVNKDGCLVLTFSDGTVKEVGVVVGKDGTSVEVPAVKSMVLEAVSAIPAPKDGINGIDGKDGTSVDILAVKSMVVDAVAALPKPADGKDGRDAIDGKDGAPGLNGADGLGFDDLDVAFDEQNGVVLRFVRGADVKEFPIPAPFDAGVWKPGTTYPKGAGVTVKGAFFIAREQTQTRPDDGTPESARAWRLSVKGGRDGKPGRDGKDSGGGNG